MNAIHEGSLVLWNPQNLVDLVPLERAKILSQMLPIPGMVTRIDGDIGRMSYLQKNMKKAEMTVKLSELEPVRPVRQSAQGCSV